MKTLFILLILNFLLFTLPTPAFAHLLKTDGSIGAVLHIDPDDDPIAGQSAGFFFDFKDKQNKFQPQNCDCTFSIIQDNRQIFSQPLFQNNSNPSLTSASIFFTFPQKDVYQVKVVGKPNPQDAFQAFTLTYDIRVARESNNQPANQTSNNKNWFTTHLPHLILGIVAAGFLIAALIKHLFIKAKTN